MKMTRTIILCLTVLWLGNPIFSFSAQKRPLIQMAILLDTSNSMDGLIMQAKTQLWKVVNELAKGKRDGQSPMLQVALFEYGKNSLPAGEGYIRLVAPLTTDLDAISEKLFALQTNGGDEFCGQVIRQATLQLEWSPNKNNMKVIFIAGNEPFTQGSVDYRQSCQEAVRRNIIVNTVFCGSQDEGIRTGWKDGADRAEGRFMAIDQTQSVADIPAPQDVEIIRLSDELNRTYIGYGRLGETGRNRQIAQDSNAAAASPGALAQRTAAKSSNQYRNAEWDLVDAQVEGKADVRNMKEEELPENMRKMSKEEREKYINEMKRKREEISKKVQSLSRERERYLQEQMKKMNLRNSLGDAIISTVREQAAKKQFHFDE